MWGDRAAELIFKTLHIHSYHLWHTKLKHNAQCFYWPGVQQYLSVVFLDDAGPEVENKVDHKESVRHHVEDDPWGSVLFSEESDAHWKDD